MEVKVDGWMVGSDHVWGYNDGVNRLTSVCEGGWSRSYYDAFGNRAAQCSGVGDGTRQFRDGA